VQPAGADVRVSVRRGETFREIGSFPVASYPDLLSYIMKLTRIEKSGDLAKEGKVVFHFRESDVVLRVSMVTAMAGECVTIRLWTNHTFPAAIDDLGLDPDTAGRFRCLTNMGRGLVLFASWNLQERCRLLDLYLDEAATAGKNVLIIGEGIGKGKKSFPRIPLTDNQRETLETVMTALDDHDPDIIILEDATGSRPFLSAWKAAMRRRLVVAGISCSGMGGVIDYLLSERHFNHSVMSGISGIVACSGIRTLCPHCRESRPSPGEEAAIPYADLHFSARGCAKCGYSGLNGMKYLLDVVSVDADFREAFGSARESSELLENLAGSGYRGINGQLDGLLQSGEISAQEYAAARVRF
jgi:type II secretory ATPase GspE/PulE/Tfp pilus assembly ATPase PilB-like protein